MPLSSTSTWRGRLSGRGCAARARRARDIRNGLWGESSSGPVRRVPHAREALQLQYARRCPAGRSCRSTLPRRTGITSKLRLRADLGRTAPVSLLGGSLARVTRNALQRPFELLGQPSLLTSKRLVRHLTK